METQSFYDYLEKKFPIKTSGTIHSYKKALKILDTLFRDQYIFHLDGMPLGDIKNPALIAWIVDYVVDEEDRFKKGISLSSPQTYPYLQVMPRADSALQLFAN